MGFNIWKVGLPTVIMVALPAMGYAMSFFYSYDSSNRLVTAKQSINATSCQIYSYDATGNILTTRTDDTGAATTSEWGSGTWGCLNWSAASNRK
jgi:hypothetical protein